MAEEQTGEDLDMAASRRSDHVLRMQRVKTALNGLSLGDALGQQFFYRQSWAMARSSRQLPLGPWKYTDDTEMALAISEVLQTNGAIDQDSLALAFARRYVADPYRGYGSGAHEILGAISAGEQWREAAGRVFDGQGSMGNGAAMRVAPVGAYFADDISRVVHEARLSAEVTHLHPEGIAGAIAIAVACAVCCRLHDASKTLSAKEFFAEVLAQTPASATRDMIEIAANLPPEMWEHDVAARLGDGSRVTAADTVPFCLWVAAHHLEDYTDAFWATVHVGGDIDTNCAIVGGIVALTVGDPGLPAGWLKLRETIHI